MMQVYNTSAFLLKLSNIRIFNFNKIVVLRNPLEKIQFRGLFHSEHDVRVLQIQFSTNRLVVRFLSFHAVTLMYL